MSYRTNENHRTEVRIDETESRFPETRNRYSMDWITVTINTAFIWLFYDGLSIIEVLTEVWQDDYE
jgi:hypothetical protein